MLFHDITHGGDKCIIVYDNEMKSNKLVPVVQSLKKEKDVNPEKSTLEYLNRQSKTPLDSTFR